MWAGGKSDEATCLIVRTVVAGVDREQTKQKGYGEGVCSYHAWPWSP